MQGQAFLGNQMINQLFLIYALLFNVFVIKIKK